MVESFTHKKVYDVILSKKFLGPEDHVLLIDDFLANGCALLGKDYRYMKILCYDTCDSDTGCLDCKNFGDRTVCKTSFELLPRIEYHKYNFT